MQATPIRKGRILRAFLIATTAAALCGGLSAGSAYAEDDEQTFEQRIIDGFMRSLGLRSSRDEGITYRERAPLVVPPSRDLPPPESRSLSQSTPAWPSDPDVKRAAEARRKAKQPRKDALEQMYDEQRPLSPAELEKGRVATSGTGTVASSSYDPNRPVMRPSELGSISLFSGLWSKIGPAKDEVGVFRGEPERSSLIAPPAGYQTPSPNQPYGVTAPKDPNERVNRLLQDRAAGGVYNPQQ